MTAFDQAISGFTSAQLIELAAAAMARHAGMEKPQIVEDREQAARDIESRAAMPLLIPQWTTKDGTGRGVMVRALSPDDYEAAARAAYVAAARLVPTTFVRVPDGSFVPDPGMLAAREAVLNSCLLREEAARMVQVPAGLTAAHLKTWNAEIVHAIHAFGTRLADYPPALIRLELEQLAGLPHPSDATTAAPAGDPAGADPDDLDASATAGGEPDGDALS